MRNAKTVSLFLLALLVFGARLVNGQTAAPQQANLETLKTRFQKEFQAIEYLFAHGPAKKVFPPDPRQRLARWQDELAASFAVAGATVDEILRLHPPDEASWLELHETLLLYSQPVTPPEKRTVFGASETQKRARLVDAPAAAYPDAARASKAGGLSAESDPPTRGWRARNLKTTRSGRELGRYPHRRGFHRHGHASVE